MSSNVRFRGVITPITTPFSPQGEILQEVLEGNLGKYLRTSASGFLVLGSNGEAPHLRPSEKLEVTRLSSEIISPDRYFLVGIAFSSLVEASEFLEKIEGLRIDAVLVSVPS